MSDVTLDLLGRMILEMRDEMRAFRAATDVRFDRIETRLDTVEATINRHQDELTVTTAMVMRHTSEPIAWGAIERQIKSLAARIEKLESRTPSNDG